MKSVIYSHIQALEYCVTSHTKIETSLAVTMLMIMPSFLLESATSSG